MATKKTKFKSAPRKRSKASESCVDEPKIKEFSKKIVDRALSPFNLMDYMTNIMNSHQAETDLAGLRMAINTDYRKILKRYNAGDKDGNTVNEMEMIERDVLYYVGLEVGRRVSRD